MGAPADFIILCHPRSGSNLLAWTLGEHPGMHMWGEILDEWLDETTVELPKGVQPYRIGMHGADFLKRVISPTGP